MAEIPRHDRAAIKSDIALSRERLARELSGLRYELDFGRKLKTSFRRSPGFWVSVLGVFGALIAVAPARTKKVYVKPRFRFGRKPREEPVAKAGFALAGAKLLGDLARPLLLRFLTKKFSSYAGNAART